MSDLLKYENKEVENKIILIRNQLVIIDSDVAALYGVETKRVNEAVRNNPDKFPKGYIFPLTEVEKMELVENFDRFNLLKHSLSLPKAFTEKGLYMLATILKSKKATETTLAIVETYANIREFTRTMSQLAETTEKEKQKSLMQKGSDIITDILGENMHTTDTETTVELNFAVLKVKHTVKRKEEKSTDKKQQ